MGTACDGKRETIVFELELEEERRLGLYFWEDARKDAWLPLALLLSTQERDLKRARPRSDVEPRDIIAHLCLFSILPDPTNLSSSESTSMLSWTHILTYT